MRNRGRMRNVGKVFGPSYRLPHCLVSVTADGPDAVYNTMAPHGVPASVYRARVRGCSVAAYNFDDKPLTSVPSASAFMLDLVTFSAESRGGWWWIHGPA